MSVVWVNEPHQHVFDAVAAVNQTLDGTGTAPGSATPSEDVCMGDHYLAENVTHLRTHWSVDTAAVVAVGRGRLARIAALGQHMVRRMTWWYTQPQMIQISHFHAALVRTVDSLLLRSLRLSQRIDNLEAIHSSTRLRTAEEEIRALREEQSQLRERIADLEAKLKDDA